MENINRCFRCFKSGWLHESAADNRSKEFFSSVKNGAISFKPHSLIRICIAAASIIFIITTGAFSGIDTKTLFEQATEAYKSGNYGSSEMLFKKIADAADSEYRDRALYYHALSIYNQKKYKSALYEFNSFINDSRTVTLSNEARFWTGECYYRMKENLKAIEEYKRFISLTMEGPMVGDAHDRIGRIYSNLKRYEEAVIEWESALKKSSDKNRNAKRVVRIGGALYSSQKYEEAIERLNPILTSGADQEIVARARMILGGIYQKKGDHKKALVLLNSIPYSLLKRKTYQDAQYLKARSFIELGNQSSAKIHLDLYLQAGESGKYYYDAMYDLGMILSDGPEKDRGITLLENVYKSAKSQELRVKSSRRLSEIFLEKDPDRAIPYLEESINSDDPEKNKETLLFIGKSYIKVKKYKEAIRTLDRFIDKYPYDKNIDEVNFLRARVYLETGDVDRAMRLFEGIEKQNPFSSYVGEANFFLASMHYKRGNVKKAISLLNQYLGQPKIENRYGACVLLVRSYVQDGELQQAEKILNIIIKNFMKEKDADSPIYDYSMALQKAGRSPERYFNLLFNRFSESASTMKLCLMMGNENFQKKNYKKAEEYYLRYLNGLEKKDYETAFRNRLHCLYYMEKYGDVTGIIEREKPSGTGDRYSREILSLLVRSYYALKNYEKIYKTINNEDMKNLPYDDIFIYADSSLKMGDLASANDAARFISGKSGSYARLMCLIGSYHLKNNDYDEAEKTYKNVITEMPQIESSDLARIGLAELYYKKKRYRDALEKLDEIKAAGSMNNKTAITINCYFKTGDGKRASAMARNGLAQVLKSGFAKSVLKNCMRYFYKEKNPGEFSFYSKNLSMFKGQEPFINHLSGKMYFEMQMYQRSYAFFNQQSGMSNRLKKDSIYYLSRIALFHYKNLKEAESLLEKLDQITEPKDDQKLKIKLNLSIINKEMNRKEDSARYLKDVLKSNDRGNIRSQAENLYEAFGFQ